MLKRLEWDYHWPLSRKQPVARGDGAYGAKMSKGGRMRLEELKLVSFKGFSDFRLQCSRFTCLVGLNNGGKTSILHAIQLLFDILRFAFGNRVRPDPSNIRWQANPSQILRRLGFGDPEAIWLHKRTSDPCRIQASLSGGVSMSLIIHGPNSYSLKIHVDGDLISDPPFKSEHFSIIEQLWDLRPAYVPPVGAVAPAESFFNHSQLEQELDKGRSSECWRSQLFWLWNDGSREAFDGIVSRVARYLPDAKVLPPRLGHSNPPEVLIEFVEGGTTFDISTSGGGFRTLLNLATVLESSRSSCLLLDEPDAHLHATLQSAVGQMLVDFCEERDVQVLVASHAPDLIVELPLESLAWIDRAKTGAGKTNDLGRFLADLGALSKADAIRTHGADKVLFVEGSLDRSLLSHLFALSGSRNPFDDPHIIVATLPGGKGDAAHLQMFQRLTEEVFRLKATVACVLDADYEMEHDDCTSDDRVLIASLGRKEAENYLIFPEVLSRACQRVLEKRSERTGEKVTIPTTEEWQSRLDVVFAEPQIQGAVRWQVVPRYRGALDKGLDPSTKEERAETWFREQWADENWRMRHCPGKRVLAELRRRCQQDYGITLTPGVLRDAIAACPEDIQQIAERIEEHFWGSSMNR